MYLLFGTRAGNTSHLCNSAQLAVKGTPVRWQFGRPIFTHGLVVSLIQVACHLLLR